MKKKTKIIFIIVVVLIALFFLFIKPYINFKQIESKVLDAGKRYYEINSSQLPTGNKIKTVDLKDLYLKDFIDSDLKVEITDRKCSLDDSWVKVKKENNEYNYYIYLKCGMFKSNIDHEGPTITLKGKDEITLYKGEEYKESGVKSVVDNTDGKMDVKDVTIDSKDVNTSKVGTYEVTYKIKDSFNNETIKIRKVKVTETLNHIVEKNTDKTNIYKGSQYDNYVRLDGILFKIVGINSDESVKLVTSEAISAVNYDDAETWLNDYFYEKLSDSAKEYIKKDSKWCSDTVSDPSKYTKCSKYSEKNPVGLLSILDYENSKGEDGSYNLNQISLIYNLKDKKTSYYFINNSYREISINENSVISPVINIEKDAIITSGTGTVDNPYKLKGNTKNLKPGDKISDAKVGSYILYSGFKFRVISKEDDDTTKIIMDGVIENNGEDYRIQFNNKNSIDFNTSEKQNIGYILLNDATQYLTTNIFTKKKVDYPKYNQKITYQSKIESNDFKLKINIPSIYDLFSTSVINDYWFKDYSN